MNETLLRWKARIGALKGFAIIGLIVALALLITGVVLLFTALNNPGGEPLQVTIEQLVAGEIDAGRYVTVAGTPDDEAAYEYTEDGRTTVEYYFLTNRATGNMILVKAARLYVGLSLTPGKNTLITGMTRSTYSDLRDLMEEDQAQFSQYGYQTNPQLYIGQDQTPPDLVTSLILVLLGGFGTLVCGGVFFFPSMVFGPTPLDRDAQPPTKEKKDPPYKASGTFLRLASIKPTIQVGKGTRKFAQAIANLVPLSEEQLLVYIHHIYKSRYTTTETDWGIFLTPGQVTAVEPGKVYGWRDKPALRIQYRDAEQREQTVTLQFKHAAAQLEAARLLESLHFKINDTPTYT